MKLFFSYTRKDEVISMEFLLDLKKTLNTIPNLKSFIDAIDNDSIDIQNEIFNQIKYSKYLVLIISPSIFESKWVKLELEFAKKNNIRIKEININELYKIIFEIRRISDVNQKRQHLNSFLNLDIY